MTRETANVTRISGFAGWEPGDSTAITHYAPSIRWCGLTWHSIWSIRDRVRWHWKNRTLRATKTRTYKVTRVESASSVVVEEESG